VRAELLPPTGCGPAEAVDTSTSHVRFRCVMNREDKCPAPIMEISRTKKSRTQPPQHSARRHDARRRVGDRIGQSHSGCAGAAAACRAVRSEA
jgi:hypothetical protein